MLYEKLLSQVINIHFPENKFDLKGKLEWYPVTEKEKTRYLERTGKELKNQRRKYKITDVFWKKSAILFINKPKKFQCITRFKERGGFYRNGFFYCAWS